MEKGTSAPSTRLGMSKVGPSASGYRTRRLSYTSRILQRKASVRLGRTKKLANFAGLGSVMFKSCIRRLDDI